MRPVLPFTSHTQGMSLQKSPALPELVHILCCFLCGCHWSVWCTQGARAGLSWLHQSTLSEHSLPARTCGLRPHEAGRKQSTAPARRLRFLEGFSESARATTGSQTSGGSSGRARSSEAATPELPAAVSRCAELLAELPAELLARAAFRAGAHARALRGFEVHVRAKAGGGGGLNPAASRGAAFDHADVSFLQARPWITAVLNKYPN